MGNYLRRYACVDEDTGELRGHVELYPAYPEPFSPDAIDEIVVEAIWRQLPPIDAQTGGLHPAESCGKDCSGCCDEEE